MRLSLVAAVASNGVIGIENRLPWRLSADLKRFKEITWGKPIIMGRKTFESIGKPLPGRTNIVITRQRDLSLSGCQTAFSIEEAIEIAGPAAEAMVVGGAEVYRLALPKADRIYLTRVEAEVIGDAHFPELPDEEWKEIERESHPADERNEHPFTFTVLERQSL